MAKYYVKVSKSVYYDNNYEIEAEDASQASNLAKSIAKKDWELTQDVTDWVFDCAEHDITYVEEAV
tara:strand:+ start:153 stop:350 length:198 start_codon:yes stop_codon:yes gene_type:complete